MAGRGRGPRAPEPRTTPDALPHLVTPEVVAVFARHGVLSERELEARYEVFVEQYATRVGIKGATAAQIARTLLVSAAADRLEHLVADELWPLPRYAEMLHQR